MTNSDKDIGTPVIQILGLSRSGKSTLISQLMNKSIKESRYEHTTELTRYTIKVQVPLYSNYSDLLPPYYNVEVYDTPGVAQVDIPKVYMIVK